MLLIIIAKIYSFAKSEIKYIDIVYLISADIMKNKKISLDFSGGVFLFL